MASDTPKFDSIIRELRKRGGNAATAVRNSTRGIFLQSVGGMRFDEGLAEGRGGDLSDVPLMDLSLVQKRREAR